MSPLGDWIWAWYVFNTNLKPTEVKTSGYLDIWKDKYEPIEDEE